jgi:ribosome-associated protein
MPSEEKANMLLQVVDDRKAVDPVLLDLRGKTLLFDFVIVCSGMSNVHIRAIAEHVLEAADNHRLANPKTAGEQVGEWILMDFGDVVLHIMNEETRERFKLEQFWTTPQPKGALPPSPDMLLDGAEVNHLGEDADMDEGDEDFDDFDEEELEDEAFFDEADTEVEPIDEDDEDIEETPGKARQPGR